MRVSLNPIPMLLLCTMVLSCASYGYSQESNRDLASLSIDLIWRDPGDIPSRDLRYGPGSPQLAPNGPFTFIEEDKDGESPKFKVKDAQGLEWVVKLGTEAVGDGGNAAGVGCRLLRRRSIFFRSR